MSSTTYSGAVNTLFSTSIEDYTMDELLSLLGIDLSTMDNYVELKNKINTEVDKNIELLTKMNNNFYYDRYLNIMSYIIIRDL